MFPDKQDVVAISCLCVGVGVGGSTALIGRVSIVTYHGNIILDTYVKPSSRTPVTDYRTSSTGITKELLESPDAWTFEQLQEYLQNLLPNKKLVGHQLWEDLSVLGIGHYAVMTRDVALYRPFRAALKIPNPGLPTLIWQLMNHDLHVGPSDSVEWARACMDLYRSVETEWEDYISKNQWPCAMAPDSFSRCYL